MEILSIEIINIKIFFKYVFSNKLPIVSCKNIKLDSGKINCLVGTSGSGKTLISRLLMGNLDKKLFKVEGKIKLSLKDKTLIFNSYHEYYNFCFSLKKKKIFGLITQSPYVVFSPLKKFKIGNFDSYEMTLFEYIKLFSGKKHNFEEYFINIMKELKIGINKPMKEILSKDLSIGMKQRLFVSMILNNNPKFIIADEITSALDVKNTINIINLVSNYVKKNNCIFFLITHNLTVAKNFVDDIYYVIDRSIIKVSKEEI